MAEAEHLEGIVTGGSYDLKTLNLYTSEGTILDLRAVALNVKISNSIHRQGISGSILISESLGMDQQFGIHGNEFVEISVVVPSLENAPLDVFGVVTGIHNRTISPGGRQQIYELKFLSLQLYRSKQQRIRRTYKNMLISDMIQSIFDNYIRGEEGKPLTVFDESVGTNSAIIPNLFPYDTVSWLTTKCESSKHQNSANYYFFERPSEFVLSTLDELYSYPIVQFYTFGAVNIDPITSRNVADIYRSLRAVRVVRELDSYNDSLMGVYSSTRMSYDPVLRVSNITNFDYFDSYGDFAHLNSGYPNERPMLSNNRDLGKLNDSCIELSSKHYCSWGTQSDSLSSDAISLSRNSYTMQLGQRTGIRLEVEANGDPRRVLGEIVNVSLPSVVPVSDEKESSHKYLSANYIILSITHNISIGGVGKESMYTTSMDLGTDTFGNPFPPYLDERET